MLDELTLEIDRESEVLVKGMVDDLGQGLHSQLAQIIQPLISTLEDVNTQLKQQTSSEAQPAFNELKKSVQRSLEDLNENLEDGLNSLRVEQAKQGEVLEQVLMTLESIQQHQQE